MKRDPHAGEAVVLERGRPTASSAPQAPWQAPPAIAPVPFGRQPLAWQALRAPSRRALQSAPAPAQDALTPPLPRFAQVEPVGRCNLACRMCAVNHRPAEQQARMMSVEVFDALLAQLPGLQELHLQGLGEPLLHPEFFTLVEHAVARGIRVSANTNATLITPERARRCVSSELSALSISLDGARAATYEAIRQQASFAKVTRNIERLVRARRQMKSEALSLRLVMVLMKSNLAELPALVELAARLGVYEVLVQRLASDLAEPTLPARYLPVQAYLRAAELRGHDLAEASEVFAFARERAARLGVALHLPRLTSARSAGDAAQPGCDWPFDKLYVTAGGEALPCCMVGTPDRARLGNVLVDGVRAVWEGGVARQWRAGLLSGAPGPLCRGCALYRGTF